MRNFPLAYDMPTAKESKRRCEVNDARAVFELVNENRVYLNCPRPKKSEKLKGSWLNFGRYLEFCQS